MLLAAMVALTACAGGGEAPAPAASAGSEAVTPSTAASPTSSVADSGVLVVEDEFYREPSDADGECSLVDIYVGDGNEGGPVVVLLHCFSRTGPGRPDTDVGRLGEEIAELGATLFSFGWQSTWGFS